MPHYTLGFSLHRFSLFLEMDFKRCLRLPAEFFGPGWPLCHAAAVLSSAGLVFPTLVFVNIWFGAPLIMVNILSALQTVPKDQYEAAQLDGASAWQSFIHITVPHIRMVVGLLVVLRTIWVFNSFDIIYLITGGGPANLTQTVPIYAYNLGWGLKQLGRSSAVTVLLLLFLLVVCALYFRLLNKWEKEGE